MSKSVVAQLLLAMAGLALPGHGVDAASPADCWPGFRGNGDSITQAHQLPLTWSDTENIAWRVDLPGYGQSSPVVWRDRIFLTAIEGEMKETLHILRLDLATGQVVWKKRYPASVRAKNNDYVSKAPCTPVATADRLFALFESGDLFALDHQGQELWRLNLTRDYGPFVNNHGIGTSPVLAGNTLLIFIAQEPGGYLLAIDTDSGKTRWKADHAYASCWTTPTVITIDQQPVAIVSAPGIAAAYDVGSGKRLWQFDGLKGNTVASPTFAEGLLMIPASERGSQVALKATGSDDDRLLWRADATSSFGSPVISQGYVFTVNRDGLAAAIDTKTGKTLWDARLPASCWASPLAGAGRVYFFTRDGATIVIKPAPDFEPLAQNSLKIKGRVYGIAAVEGVLLLRTGTQLIRISQP